MGQDAGSEASLELHGAAGGWEDVRYSLLTSSLTDPRAAAPRCWSCGELVFVGVHSDLFQRLWTRTRAIGYAACTQGPVLSVLLLPEAVSQPDVHK